MSKGSVASLALSSLVLSSSIAFGVEIPLARKGKPAATIVLPADSAEKLQLAAEELQHYVQAICQVELPIQNDGKEVEGTGLYIGLCEITHESDLPDASLNPETYAIRVRDGNLFFTGRWPSPTYFAVISFIEDDLGVRWFAPGKLWEWVPKGEPGKLVVDVEDRVKQPSTSPRIWSGHAWFENWKRWNLRNKTIQSEVVPRRQFQNFLHQVFPAAKYAEEHPEYYPLVGGKRWFPGKGGRHWRPCESNPEVLDLTVAYARHWFDSHPDVDSFSLGMDDISHLCACEACRSLDAQPDSYEKREFSDRHYKFVNWAARGIRKTDPDKFIGTLIYWIARELPETVPKLEDNVFGFITETSALWWQEGRKEKDQALTRAWARRCRHLSRYDYYGMGTFCPRVYPHTMDKQIKFDKSLGMEGMYTEVYTFLPHTAPMIWAFAKLQWDHTLNIDELLREFYRKMYGESAPAMEAYFNLLEKSWNTPRPGRGPWVHRNLRVQALSMDPADVDQGLALLEEAFQSAKDEKERSRIDIHHAALQYAGYAIKAYGLSREIEETDVTNRRSADRALCLVEEMGHLALERQAFWTEAHYRNDLLGENIRALGDKKGYLQTGKISELERGGFVGAMKALSWYAKNKPKKLPAATARLHSIGEGSVCEMVKLWLWVQEKMPDNLVQNGDFEDRAKNEERPEKDWSTQGAPKAWQIWSRGQEADFASLSGKGRGGSIAATLAEAGSACYIQSLKVHPGERYLCVCWAKGDPPTKTSGAKLTVRFRDRRGEWHPRGDLEPTVSLTDGVEGWQPLVVMATVPEGAGSLLVMLGASGQSQGAAALFDDVGIYRIKSPS